MAFGLPVVPDENKTKPGFPESINLESKLCFVFFLNEYFSNLSFLMIQSIAKIQKIVMLFFCIHCQGYNYATLIN